MSYIKTMTGAEFIRAIRKLGRSQKVAVNFVKEHGKGSHGTLHYGPKITIVKDRKKEMSAGLLSKMLKQLGLRKEDIT